MSNRPHFRPLNQGDTMVACPTPPPFKKPSNAARMYNVNVSSFKAFWKQQLEEWWNFIYFSSILYSSNWVLLNLCLITTRSTLRTASSLRTLRLTSSTLRHCSNALTPARLVESNVWRSLLRHEVRRNVDSADALHPLRPLSHLTRQQERYSQVKYYDIQRYVFFNAI